MPAKTTRHQHIRALVDAGPVRSQSALRAALADEGVDVDQSTLSRDLAELGIRKVRGAYRLNGAVGAGVLTVSRIVPCGPHLMVLHTDVGHAQPIAVAIDAAGDAAIAGTIAGDDTILVATRSVDDQAKARRRLAARFGVVP